MRISLISGTFRALVSLWLAVAVAGAGTVVDLNGKQVDPFASSRGHALVLLFVRVDCPISNRYAPAIQQLAVKYGAKVNFWLVYPGKSQTAQTVKEI